MEDERIVDGVQMTNEQLKFNVAMMQVAIMELGSQMKELNDELVNLRVKFDSHNLVGDYCPHTMR